MTQLLEKADQVTVYHDRTWDQFKHIQKGLESLLSVRLSYYDGRIEILRTGANHEFFQNHHWVSSRTVFDAARR